MSKNDYDIDYDSEGESRRYDTKKHPGAKRRFLTPQELKKSIFSKEKAHSKIANDMSPIYQSAPVFPMEVWAEGWIFKDIPDRIWHIATQNSEKRFPVNPEQHAEDKAHPGYIRREIGNYIVVMMPLSTKKFDPSYPFISPETTLEGTGRRLREKSYLVEKSWASFPRKNEIFENLPEFMGILPYAKLERE